MGIGADREVAPRRTLGATNLGLLALTSTFYLAVGVIAFRAFERTARTRGVIGVH